VTTEANPEGRQVFDVAADALLDAAKSERIIRRHRSAAIVRSRASAILWLAAVAALVFEILPRDSVLGITGAVLYLILLNPPTLWVLGRLRTRRQVQLWSLAINLFEIAGYTAVIHFSGGIEATALTLIYAALITYTGILGRESLPFTVAALCSLAFSLMVVAEQVGWLAHRSLLSAWPIPWRTQIVITLVTVSLLFVVASLASRASSLLWGSKKKLRQSESQFRTLVENVPGLVFLENPGPEPEILYLGGQVQQLTGRSAEDLLAAKRTLLALCHPDDRLGVGAKVDLAILDRTDYVVDYRLQHADGSWRWVEERGRGVYDAGGKLLFLEGIVLEISERKSLEKETSLRAVIQQVAREWQLTFDTVESPILILDSQGCIIRLNRAARDLAGFSYDECKGRSMSSLREGEPWQVAHELISEALQSRGHRPLHRMVADGTRTWELTATMSPRFAEEHCILIMQDASRVVELEDSLRRGEKLAAMGALVGGVAHEVRNPLFGVSATLDAMKADFGSDEALKPYLNGLRSQVDRMTNLMNGLLEYGRSARVERSLGRLDQVIAQAVADCVPLAEEVRVEVTQQLDLDGLTMAINHGGLVTLFGNLLSNALQHSPPGSEVVIAAAARQEKGERWVECSITDSGAGFASEALARACEPFYSRRPGGMGLGLAIVERIVEDHGGRLELGNGPGGGARVKVRLPIEAEIGNGAAANVPA
jgi:PAS domain S-box-containing protein